MSRSDLKRYASDPRFPIRGRPAIPLLTAIACITGFAAVYALKPRHISPTATEVVSTPTLVGAAVTATDFVRAIDYRVMLNAERRRAVIARFAAPGAAPALESQLTRGLDALRTSVSAGDVVSAPALVGYRTRRLAPDRASVSVWGVLLFGTAVEPTRSIWRTSTFELVWRGNHWRISRHVAEDGPSSSWPIAELASTAASFRRYRDVP